MIKIVVLMCLVFAPVWAAAEEQLVFAVDVIRHGDRTAIGDIPKAPHVWADGAGQLTAAGMRQEYELGARMRAAYVDKYHLLPANYRGGTVYVRSSDIDRTLMSAQSFLTGLYPHGTGPALDGKPALPDRAQPVPVHTVAGNEETLLYPDGPLYKFNELRARYVTLTREWADKNAALLPNYARWSAATGVTITDVDQLKSLGDTLFVRQNYSVPPPQGLTAEDVRTIIDAGRWAFVTEFRPVEIGQATGGALLGEVMNYLRDSAKGKTELKYVLFSAHDSTILSEMSALGAPLAEPPHYASRLNFALFSDGAGNYSVRVAYNDAPVAVKGCGAEACTLPQFFAVLKR